MKKIFTLVVGMLLICSSIWARTPEEAAAIASGFMSQKGTQANVAQRVQQAKRAGVASSTVSLEYTQFTKSNENAVYVFNHTDGGFVLVSAKDESREVLGYCDEGSFNKYDIPTNMQYWLQMYADELASIETTQSVLQAGQVALSRPQKMAANTTDYPSITPLLGQVEWGQGYPYNNMCPQVNGERCVTGCVATALSQIMYVHKYPTTGIGNYSYTTESGISASADFGATTYQWNQMLPNYDGDVTTTNINSVATLMYHVGVASNMAYGVSASGANSSIALNGLCTYFGYDKGITPLPKDFMPEEDILEAVATELQIGHPLYVSGRTKADEGHAFVCDGMLSSGYLHINWGWNGYCNGYYVLSALNPEQQGTGGSANNYAFTESVVVYAGVQPDKGGEGKPMITANSMRRTSADEIGRSDNVSFSMDYFENKGTAIASGSVYYIIYDLNGNVASYAGIGDFELQAGYYYTKPISVSQTIPSDLANGEYELEVAWVDGQSTIYPIYVKNHGRMRFPMTVTSNSVVFAAGNSKEMTVMDAINQEQGDTWQIDLYSENFWDDESSTTDQLLRLYLNSGSAYSLIGSYLLDDNYPNAVNTISADALYAVGNSKACKISYPTDLHVTIAVNENNTLTLQYYMVVNGEEISNTVLIEVPNWYIISGGSYYYYQNYINYAPAAPLAASKALALTQSLNHTDVTPISYLVNGVVSNMRNTPKEILKYNTARFDISDDGTTNNQFYCYNTKWLNNSDYTTGQEIALTDDVIVHGQLQNYLGSTPEIKGYVYQHTSNHVYNYHIRIKKSANSPMDVSGGLWMWWWLTDANGQLVELQLDEDGWYSTTVSASANSINCLAVNQDVNGDSGWTGSQQTVDYKDITGDICLEIGNDTGYGQYAIYETSCENSIEPSGITYVLNGGVTNDYGWLNKGDMWTAFCADAGITTLGTLEEVKALGDPYSAICTPLDGTKAQAILDHAKWDWLEAYVMAVQNADLTTPATQLVAGTTSAGWRYALAAFFLESQRTYWPKSADFSQAGKIEAFQPAWQHGFANPTNPVSEFVLNAPYKEGYTFAGWYTNADFSGEKVTTINAETTGTLYAKWIDETWQITYTSSNDSIVTPYKTDVFGANIVSNTYENGVGTITFDGPVTNIGNSAFRYCSSLISITIPNSVMSIGNRALSHCTSLTSITIPNSVTSIGFGAFDRCSLISITIPNSVTSIGEIAFRASEFLESIFVESGNTTYDSRENCNAIIETATNTLILGCQNTVIPNSVTSVGDYAFRNCSSMTSIEIPNSVTSIGKNAFSDCSSLASIIIPNSVESIGYRAFYSCSSLTSITVPNSVTSIGNSAFLDCSNLTVITIPNSVTSIEERVFSYCKSIESIVVESGNTTYDSRNNCNAIIETATNTLISGCQNTIIPNSVTSIGNSAFEGCKFTSITIPNNVISIVDWSFADCDSLATVTIGNSVRSIGVYAFRDCLSLDTIYAEATTPPTLGEDVFYRTPSPICVIPCGTLAAYEASDWASQVSEFIEGECDPTWQITYTSTDGNIVTPNATDVFGANIVSNVYENGVGTITFDGPVTSIGDHAFRWCNSLTSITIPNSVMSIGVRALSHCTSLTSITIPNSVTSIGFGAFDHCSLISITIPNSVTSIGEIAFRASEFLESIFVESGNTTYDSRENCNAIIETATNTLILGCQNTVIPNSVTSVGDYAFRNCSSMTSIEIPNSVTSIGERAFYGCSGLTSITIPNSVTSIGNGAFRNCSSLDTIHIEAITPPTLGTDAFTSSPICYIPCGTKAAYEASDWAQYVSEFVEEGCAPIQMCGDDLYWEYADGLLTITGTGEMYDYATDIDVPWYDVRGKIETAILPDAMTKIGQNAFYKCIEMTTINMPAQLVSIGEKAFAQDTKLTSELILPATLVEIGERAFFNCKAVAAYHIEATTPPTLGDKAFDYVHSPIHVPCGYGHVYGKHAQWGALNLQMCELLQDKIYYYPIDATTARAVTYHSTPTDSVVIPSTVVINGVKRTVTEIADRAFMDCDKLPGVVFNEGLTTIGERAFVRCYGLSGTIVLPSTLTTIGERAFSYCDYVTKYILQAMTPPALANNVFTGSNSNALFYISCEAMDDYKVATNWSNLKSRFVDACLNIYHYNTALGANGVYATEGTLVAGIYYRRLFTPNVWETLYLPFDVDRVTVLEDGIEYDLEAWSIFSGGHYFLAKPYGVENKEVVFGFTTELKPDTPYIIQFKDEYYRDKMITFYGSQSWNHLSTSFEALTSSFDMQMAGNTTLQDQILEEPVYMLRASSNFLLQKTTTTLHPFECYVMPYATSSGTPARMNVRMRDDVATAVESVKGNESHLTYIVDGYTLTVYPQGQAFSIYSLNGALIYSCEAGKEAVDCELNSGCYLLHAGTEAHKIML